MCLCSINVGKHDIKINHTNIRFGHTSLAFQITNHIVIDIDMVSLIKLLSKCFLRNQSIDSDTLLSTGVLDLAAENVCQCNLMSYLTSVDGGWNFSRKA